MESRHYPIRCQSAYCGCIECPIGCPYLPALLEFKHWQREHNAYRPDPIWSPTLWVAKE